MKGFLREISDLLEDSVRMEAFSAHKYLLT